MNERLDLLLRMYRNNEYLIRRSPSCWEWVYENEVLFEKMMECIPQSHYDEINLIVYGIRRV